jgi:aspartyl protease family protein
MPTNLPPRAPPPEPPRRPWFRLLVIGGVVAIVLIGARSLSPARLTSADFAWMAPLAVISVLAVFQLAGSRQPLGKMAKQLGIVLALGAALMVLYTYKDDWGGLYDRALATLVPGRGVQVAPGVMTFTADSGGQFAIDAKVDGTPIHFLVDTGASGVVLSTADAEALGLNLNDLLFTGQFSTANGMTRGARVTLKSLQIGPIATHDVTAWVNEGDLDVSLLGMSFLTTLGRVEMRGDRLTIEQ